MRNRKSYEKKIILSESVIPVNPYTLEGKHSSIERIREDVFYMDLSQLTRKQCDSFFNANAEGVENLIIDLGYNANPELRIDDICDYLINERREFVKVLAPLKMGPSQSHFIINKGLIGNFLSPFTVGKASKRKYVNGKIILMVNRRTQSSGEYFGMAIQQADNCVTIGNQTAGSVMNITTFDLPDGTSFDFTSMMGFCPNTKVTVQKNGLKIDHNVDIQANEYNPDQYIKAALKMLNK